MAIPGVDGGVKDGVNTFNDIYDGIDGGIDGSIHSIKSINSSFDGNDSNVKKLMNQSNQSILYGDDAEKGCRIRLHTQKCGNARSYLLARQTYAATNPSPHHASSYVWI